VAGIIDGPIDVPAEASFREEAPLLIAEGMAPIALKLILKLRCTEIPSLQMLFGEVAQFQEVRTLTADATCKVMLEALGNRKIPVVVIKGPAVARFHGEEWRRLYGDIDLLIPERYFVSATRVANQCGYYQPAIALPAWPSFDRVCREGVNLHGPGNVDIHHHVPPWRFGMQLSAEAIVADSEPWILNGQDVHVASLEHSAVIAALHILNDLWKRSRGLVSWRDLIVLLRTADPVRLRYVFDEVGLVWLLDLVIQTLHECVPGAIPYLKDADSDAEVGSWRLRALGWSGDSLLTRQRGAWSLRLPFMNSIWYIVGSIVPAPKFIQARYGSYACYWSRALSETASSLGVGWSRPDRQRGPGVLRAEDTGQ
jgi:hypothetical protein